MVSGPSERAMRRSEVDVTAEAVTGLGAGFASLPSWTLDENQLADLEMLLSGVFAPLTGFMTAADVSAVWESGTLADGFPWPVPVTLDVPEDAVPPAQRRLALNDPEGVPLAVLDISERSPALMPSAAPAARDARRAAGAGLARRRRGTRVRAAGAGRGRVWRYPPVHRRARGAQGPDRHPGGVGRRLGLRPGGRGVAPAGPDRARHGAGR